MNSLDCDLFCSSCGTQSDQNSSFPNRYHHLIVIHLAIYDFCALLNTLHPYIKVHTNLDMAIFSGSMKIDTTLRFGLFSENFSRMQFLQSFKFHVNWQIHRELLCSVNQIIINLSVWRWVTDETFWVLLFRLCQIILIEWNHPEFEIS